MLEDKGAERFYTSKTGLPVFLAYAWDLGTVTRDFRDILSHTGMTSCAFGEDEQPLVVVVVNQIGHVVVNVCAVFLPISLQEKEAGLNQIRSQERQFPSGWIKKAHYTSWQIWGECWGLQPCALDQLTARYRPNRSRSDGCKWQLQDYKNGFGAEEQEYSSWLLKNFSRSPVKISLVLGQTMTSAEITMF